MPISFAPALGHEPSDKRIEILRLIHQGGSISQAARAAGVSYKAAWQAIDTLTNLAGVDLVEREVGGAGGGGARVTEAGAQLLMVADLMDEARRKVLRRVRQGSPGAEPGLSQRAMQLTVRTSMRNQLPCRVLALEGKGQLVRVRLQLPDQSELVSRITRESAELLALQAGQPVLALCKATAARVSRLSADAAAPRLPRAVNRLPGRASRISRGENGDEVSVALDAGPQLVGFAPAGSALRTRQRVCLDVDEVAVVVALAG